MNESFDSLSAQSQERLQNMKVLWKAQAFLPLKILLPMSLKIEIE